MSFRGAVGAALLTAATVAACGWTAPGPGLAESCRRVAVRDVTDPAAPPVRGIEDIAVTGKGLYLSAQDRRFPLNDAPRGGIYWLPKNRLPEAHLDRRIAVREITGALTSLEHMLPHGIAVEALDDRSVGDALLVIDRRPEGDTSAPALWRLPVSEGPEGPMVQFTTSVARGPSLCNANDVLALGDGLALATRHLEACGGLGRLVEIVTASASGSVIALSLSSARPRRTRVVHDGLAFANGLAPLGPGADGDRLSVAASRDDRLWILDPATGTIEPFRGPDDRPLDLPGVDNLSAAPDGGLLVASHPDLFTLFLHLQGAPFFETAPSRIFHVTQGEPARLLYASDARRPDDSAFSGATVAVVVDGWLVVGAAVDDGLLICRMPSDATDSAGAAS